VLIGASTGGPAHIEKILSRLPAPLPFSIVIAQHMGAEFLPSFVQRLRLKTSHDIVLAQEGMSLCSQRVYITSNTTTLQLHNSLLHFSVQNSSTARFNPDIDALFTSFTQLSNLKNILAIILTGIGDDGINGCIALASRGVRCLAESQKTAIVYGMPARAKEQVSGVAVLDLYEIIEQIKKFGGV